MTTKETFSFFNIFGIKVEVKRLTLNERFWFCAYADLKNSRYLSDTFLGYPTYRKEDIVGVDTAHAFNERQNEAEKLASALHQIESIIKSWKSATEEGYHEGVQDDN